MVERSIESVSHVKSGQPCKMTRAGDWMSDVSGKKTRPDISNGCCLSALKIQTPASLFLLRNGVLRRLQV